MTKNQSQFIQYLTGWQHSLSVRTFADLIPNPKHAAVISVDLINGFCSTGPLASPRIQGIVPSVMRFFRDAWDYGIRGMVLTQDTHVPDAIEFGSFPPHCVRGTVESETIPEIKNLPFFKDMEVIEKNSIHSGINTGLQQWLDTHPKITTYIVVGDCTDLCVYQLAMHLRLDANARQMKRRIIVPEDCVATYDMPVDAAKSLGSFPHDGDLLHSVFLYHMALNGIEVVKSVILSSSVKKMN